MSDSPAPPPPATPRVPALRRAPEQREMLLIGGMAFFLNLFPGTILQLFSTRWGLVVTQTVFIAGPVLGALRWFYLDPRSVLPLRRPPGVMMGAALLATVALNHLLTIAGAWQERLFPTPASLREFFTGLFVYQGPVDYTVLLVVFAFIPAVCEELLFRGFLQSGFIRLFESAPRGISAGALVFALFHLDPWRFPGILVLGLFLGYLVHRTGSLLPAILAHALNNLLSISFTAAGLEEQIVFGSSWTAGLALALLACAQLLVRRTGAGSDAGRVL